MVLLSANKSVFGLIVNDWAFWVKVFYATAFNMLLFIYRLRRSDFTTGADLKDFLEGLELISISIFNIMAIMFVARY